EGAEQARRDVDERRVEIRAAERYAEVALDLPVLDVGRRQRRIDDGHVIGPGADVQGNERLTDALAEVATRRLDELLDAVPGSGHGLRHELHVGCGSPRVGA